MNSPLERRVSRLERAWRRQLVLDKDWEVTLDRLTEMASTAYRVAIDAGSADAAVKAVVQLSWMHGFDVGKRPNERSPIEDLTADERDAVRRMVREALERARGDNRLREGDLMARGDFVSGLERKGWRLGRIGRTLRLYRG